MSEKNPLMSLFSSGLIKPKYGLNLLKDQIEKKTKSKVDSFNLIFMTNRNFLTFDVTTIEGQKNEYQFDDTNNFLVDIIKKYIAKNLDKSCELTAFTAGIDKDKAILRMFFIENNEKKQQEIIL